MNTINRVVIVLGLIVLAILMSAVFVLPHVVLPSVGGWLSRWGDYFLTMKSPVLRLIGGLFLAAIFDVIMLVLIFLEVRPRRKRFIRVQQAQGGMVTLSNESVTQQLQYKLDPVPGVLKVTPKVTAKGDQVQATVDVDVAAGTNVPAIAKQLTQTVKSVLSESLGLQVHGEPEVRIKVAPGPAGVTPQPQPRPQPKPQPQPRRAEPVAPPRLPEPERVASEPPPIPPSERSKGESESDA